MATRTGEGLARLRRKLLLGGRKREAWLSSILSLPSPAIPGRVLSPPAALTGALTVGMKTKLAVAGALLVGATLAYRSQDHVSEPVLDQGPTPDASALAVAEFVEDLSDAPELEGRTEKEVREVAPESPSLPAWHPPIEPVPEILAKGRVIDLSAAPVAGVDVCRIDVYAEAANFPGADGEGRRYSACVPSDPAGRFEIEGRPPLPPRRSGRPLRDRLSGSRSSGRRPSMSPWSWCPGASPSGAS